MEKFVDFAAAGRVAMRVDLKDVRVTNVSAKCDPAVHGPLEPLLDFECAVVGRENNLLEIACNYQFAARTADAQIAEAAIKYLLAYEVRGTDPLAEEDLAEFAASNGTLHSWPFVREFLYGLTAKMGYPPYMLPVVHFKPKPQPQVNMEATKKAAPNPESIPPK